MTSLAFSGIIHNGRNKTLVNIGGPAAAFVDVQITIKGLNPSGEVMDGFILLEGH